MLACRSGAEEGNLDREPALQFFILSTFAPLITLAMTIPGSQQKIILRYSTEWADIAVREDQIVEVQLFPKAYSKSRVSAVINKIKEITGRSNLLVLIKAHPKSTVTIDGLNSVFSKPNITYSTAKAYVLPMAWQFAIAKTARLFFKPKKPIRFFRTHDAAETWLSSFRGYGI